MSAASERDPRFVIFNLCGCQSPCRLACCSGSVWWHWRSLVSVCFSCCEPLHRCVLQVPAVDSAMAEARVAGDKECIDEYIVENIEGGHERINQLMEREIREELLLVDRTAAFFCCATISCLAPVCTTVKRAMLFSAPKLHDRLWRCLPRACDPCCVLGAF